MKRSKLFLLMLVLLVILLPIQPVQADMAPLPGPAIGGMRPLQYQPTEVQMVYERVELTIQPKLHIGDNPDNGMNNELVDVTAWFVMHNTGTQDEEMQAAFPLGSLNNVCNHLSDERSWGLQTFIVDNDSFKVSMNGIQLDTEIKEIEGIECVNWAIFDIRFPVNQDVLVKVDYSAWTEGIGSDMLLQYVLETGAGWKGPIKQAYIIARFPYLTTDENITTALTTPGFQYLYNEIFWSYRDLEPTPDDNISIRFFEPLTWERILALRDVVNRSPTDVNAWMTLLGHYGQSANTDKIHNAYEKALLANPNSAEIYALYAYQLNNECCVPEKGRFELLPTEKADFVRRVLPLVNKALALDAKNKMALDLLNGYLFYAKDTTFTPPPTIPPTATPLVSETPTATPTQTRTPVPSSTSKVERVEVTVVQTRIVSATPANTTTPQPSPAPSVTATPSAAPTQSSGEFPSWLVWPVLLVIGFVGGIFVARRK